MYFSNLAEQWLLSHLIFEAKKREQVITSKSLKFTCLLVRTTVEKYHSELRRQRHFSRRGKFETHVQQVEELCYTSGKISLALSFLMCGMEE